MGRGRQKAKQTKVARELKYSVQNTDYVALERELHGGPSPGGGADVDGVPDEVDDVLEPVARPDLESAAVGRVPLEDSDGYEDWIKGQRR